jgi:hypothetical protein
MMYYSGRTKPYPFAELRAVAKDVRESLTMADYYMRQRDLKRAVECWQEAAASAADGEEMIMFNQALAKQQERINQNGTEGN